MQPPIERLVKTIVAVLQPNAPASSPAGLNLALQGGGAHGAFTWGVLDRLLEEDRFALGTISATSAGAVNAAALLSGLATGGNAGARETLAAVWQAVHKASTPSFAWLNPFLAGWSGQMAELGASMPYAMSPLDVNPLRAVLLETIDFKAIKRHASLPDTLIAATAVTTGRARLFKRAEISLDVILASACLPALMRAVTIDGIAYWDGGFSANPDLVTLASESQTGDTLVVLLNGKPDDDLPGTAREIADHVSALTFSQPFLRDVRQIAAVREAMAALPLLAKRAHKRLAAHRFHLIDGTRHTRDLGVGSKLMPDWDMLTTLRDAGRQDAEGWLAANSGWVGKRSTVDLVREYLPRLDRS